MTADEIAADHFHVQRAATIEQATARRIARNKMQSGDRRDTTVITRCKRDLSAARLHVVDRATQGLDDGDALEICHSYLDRESLQTWDDYKASYGADWDGGP